MFGLFKKKEAKIAVTDYIWMHEQAKWQACHDLYQQNNHTVFMAWFEDSKNKLQEYFGTKSINLADIRNVNFAGSVQIEDEVIFIEHFPLQAEEQSKFADLGLQEAKVYSALDEAIFEIFGGKRIVELMQKMDMKENEMIQHNMITAAIKRAQEKIAEKAMVTGSARSQRDWMLNAGLTFDQ
jgi:hypothetical protein